jgi:hypothetical protein
MLLAIGHHDSLSWHPPTFSDRQQNLWVKSGQFTGGTEVDF